MTTTDKPVTAAGSTGSTVAAAPAPGASYAANYRILASMAERLRTGREDDIDGLAADFRKAMGAYRACLARLDAVQAEIDEELDRLAPEEA